MRGEKTSVHDSKKLNGNSEECPHCGANLIGQEIPKNVQYMFGGAKYGLRVIGIERLGDDYVSSYRCPDCGAEDKR